MTPYNKSIIAFKPDYQPSHQRSPIVRVSRRYPCKICGHADWCSFTEDDQLAFCMRTAAGSFKQAANGAYLHRLTNESPPVRSIKRPKQTSVQATPRASAEHCDTAYEALIYTFLVLSREHESKLLARGLDPVTIRVNGYVSAPTKGYGQCVARALSAKFGLDGVPGFFYDGGKWHMVDYGPGFFIPVRDAQGRLVGLQIRRDEGKPRYIWFSSNPGTYPQGTSSGAPTHYAKPGLLRDAQEVVITEGALKADVIAYLTGEPVIGIAGTCSFGADFATRLKESFPNLRRVAIAYDRDLLEKKEVYGALLRLTAQLEKASFRVRIRTWPPPHKGYDDYLLSQLTRREVQAA